MTHYPRAISDYVHIEAVSCPLCGGVLDWDEEAISDDLSRGAYATGYVGCLGCGCVVTVVHDAPREEW